MTASMMTSLPAAAAARSSSKFPTRDQGVESGREESRGLRLPGGLETRLGGVIAASPLGRIARQIQQPHANARVRQVGRNRGAHDPRTEDRHLRDRCRHTMTISHRGRPREASTGDVIDEWRSLTVGPWSSLPPARRAAGIPVPHPTSRTLIPHHTVPHPTHPALTCVKLDPAAALTQSNQP